jgi:hypothetical protein
MKDLLFNHVSLRLEKSSETLLKSAYSGSFDSFFGFLSVSEILI